MDVLGAPSCFGCLLDCQLAVTSALFNLNTLAFTVRAFTPGLRDDRLENRETCLGPMIFRFRKLKIPFQKPEIPLLIAKIPFREQSLTQKFPIPCKNTFHALLYNRSMFEVSIFWSFFTRESSHITNSCICTVRHATVVRHSSARRSVRHFVFRTWREISEIQRES